MKFRLAAAIALLAVSTVAKADNLVVNPDFSAYPVGSTVTTYPGYGAVTGWSGTDSNANIGINTNAGPFYDNGTAPTATVGILQAASIDPDYLTQTLTGLSAGHLYAFSFYENARQGIPVTLTFSIGGETLYSDTFSATYGDFTYVSGFFTATSSSELLSFEATSTGDATALLTEVSVSAAPEPSSLMLLGSGLLGVAGIARRRFSK